MKRVLLALLVAVLVGLSASAQSAHLVIKKHVKAAGGAKKLAAISSVRYSGTVTVNGGEARPFTWMGRRPDRLYIEIQTERGALIEAYSGRSGWREDAAGGLRTLTGREQTRARATALFRVDRFQTYKKEKSKAGVVGQDTVDGRAVYVVEMTSHTGVQRRLAFDRATYALLRETQEREDGVEEILYRDYRAVNGVLEPHRITMRRGGGAFEVAISEVAHNPAIEDAVFSFPQRAQAAVTDITALMREVEKNQEAVEKIQENYTYNMTETNLEVDGKGKLKQKWEKTYEVFHLGGRSIQKLVAQEGRALAPGEQKKEQERIEKVIREHEKWKKEEPERQAKEKNEQEKKRLKEERERARRKAQGQDEKAAAEDDDNLQLSDFMRIAQLTNPRRERFRGEEVLVFEFSPRPGYKARNRGESLVQKLGGVVWIDEQAKQIARLEARMLDNFRVGGGLMASLHRGSAIVFEQEMVKGEVWLPRYAEINFSARVLLLAGFKINRIQKFDHYQKFNVDSINVIKAPPAPPQP